MRAFIKHSLDGSEIVERIEVSHPGSLAQPGQGYRWTETPAPVSAWTIAVDAEGNVVPAPHVRPPERMLDLAKRAMRSQVKLLREAAEYGGFAAIGHRLDSTPESQRRITIAAGKARNVGPQFKRKWRMADNSTPELNQGQMLAIENALDQHIDACQQRKNALDAEIDQAAMLAALEDIDIMEGWPR